MCSKEEISPESMEWWKKSIVYQVYPRSFMDSNGDGIGDIPGITSKLDYFKDIGVETIWLSPFYPSPQLDFGYDVADYRDVDPQFGTLDDFDELVKQLHKRGMKLMIDFVPGHTSHLHTWFQKSVKREDPYTDFYVWHDGLVGEDGKRLPPNNWLSVFTGSAWTWNEERGQFYYRPFLPEQPKLNFRCPQVIQEMKDVVRFWMEHGADGMRVDALAQIMEAEDKSLDEPRNPKIQCQPDEFEYHEHIHTAMLPEGFALVKDWREVMDEYEKKDGNPRFMVIEVYDEGRNSYRKYGGIPFNMDLIDRLDELGLTGDNIKKVILEEYDNLGPEDWPTFVLGNHDRHRIRSRWGSRYGDALNMLLLTLKGTPTTYYGEELGMEDIEVSYEETQDPFGKNMGPDRYVKWSRDPCRSPMQWDDTPQAGFTTSNKPWLPVHPDYKTVNVKAESKENGKSTPLKVYRALAKLRTNPVFTCGSLTFAHCNDDLISYVRQHTKYPDRFLVAINVGQREVKLDLSRDSAVKASRGDVVISTSGVDKTLLTGGLVQLDQITLAPGDGIVVKLAKAK